MAETNEGSNTKKPGLFRRTGGYFRNEAGKMVSEKELRKGAEFIKDLSQDLVKPKTGRNERFFEAVQRMNLKPQQVLDNYKIFRLNFKIYGACAAIALFLMLFFTIRGSYFSLLAGSGALSIFFAQTVIYSFRAFQIRKMKLCSFQEWFERKDMWIPKDFNEKKWLLHWEKIMRSKALKQYDLVPIETDQDFDR